MKSRLAFLAFVSTVILLAALLGMPSTGCTADQVAQSEAARVRADALAHSPPVVITEDATGAWGKIAAELVGGGLIAWGAINRGLKNYHDMKQRTIAEGKPTEARVAVEPSVVKVV